MGGCSKMRKSELHGSVKQGSSRMGGLDNVRTFLSLFVVLLPDHCIHHLEAGSRCSDSLQKQRTEPVEEERYSPLSTATRNEPIPKPEGEKKTTWKQIHPALTSAALSTFSALHQIGKKTLFFTVVQRWDFSPSFSSSAVLVLRCLLQVKHPLSLTWPRWRRKRSCKRAPSAWLKQMVHKGEK